MDVLQVAIAFAIMIGLLLIGMPIAVIMVALGTVGGFLAFGWLLFRVAFWKQKMTEANEGSASQKPNALMYSVDAFVPLIDFHQAKFWLPKAGVMRGYLWLHTIAGWTLTTLLLAGVTGLVR